MWKEIEWPSKTVVWWQTRIRCTRRQSQAGSITKIVISKAQRILFSARQQLCSRTARLRALAIPILRPPLPHPDKNLGTCLLAVDWLLILRQRNVISDAHGDLMQKRFLSKQKWGRIFCLQVGTIGTIQKMKRLFYMQSTRVKVPAVTPAEECPGQNNCLRKKLRNTHFKMFLV